MVLTAEEIIRTLNLKPHPEGGHYCEEFRDEFAVEGRSASTAIYYLLQGGERSHWHRIDTAEVWHHYAGAALELQIAEEGKPRRTIHLGTDLAAGQRPQVPVPGGAWQAAEPKGEWVLVGCTVAPGFEFAKFKMAPPDWSPTD